MDTRRWFLQKMTAALTAAVSAPDQASEALLDISRAAASAAALPAAASTPPF